MEKKVGNYITIFLLLMTAIVQASSPSIVISMYGVDNKPIAQAMINSQFVLQVVFNNINVGNDMPTVPGIEQFRYRFNDRSSNISMYNGRSVSKTIYKFTMQTDTGGIYSVGPVTYTDRTGKKFESNSLDIHVGNEIISTTVNSQNNQQEKYKITAEFDESRVYVGQPVTLKIKFIDYVGVDQSSLLFPEFENLIIIGVQEHRQVRKIDAENQEYFETEWIIECYLKQAGFFVAENIKIRFLDIYQRDDFFGRSFFGAMTSMMHIQKDLSARPVGLDVVSLPENEKFQNISTVGQFSEIKVSMNKGSVVQGQGVTLAVDIIGIGNFEMIDSFPLILPEGLVSYDSNAPQVDINRTHKHFEYIIQAQDVGTYQIPSQSFSYFDSADGQYKTLQSKPFELVITPGVDNYHDQYQNVLSDQDEEDINEIGVLKYNILGQESIHTQQKMIPLRWYMILMKALILIFSYMLLHRYFLQKYVFRNKYLQRLIAFFQAYRACKIAEAQGDKQALYSIFINLFIHLKVDDLSSIDDAVIEQYLKDKGFSSELIQQWNLFYNTLLQASFSQFYKKNNSSLFKEAYKWLHLLKIKA
jgi:hypothetical protein